MTSSMVIIERQEKRASVTGSADSTVSSSASAVIRLLRPLSSCLSQDSSARVGEGTATF